MSILVVILFFILTVRFRSLPTACDLTQPQESCDVRYQRCAAHADAAVARARGADGAEKWGKQEEERKCLPPVLDLATYGEFQRLVTVMAWLQQSVFICLNLFPFI